MIFLETILRQNRIKIHQMVHQMVHQIAPLKFFFFLGGGHAPKPPGKAHGFAIHSMSLRNMQISKSENKFLGPPYQILATPL